MIFTPLSATLALWVVISGKIFLRDARKIMPGIIAGAILVVAGTIAVTLANA